MIKFPPLVPHNAVTYPGGAHADDQLPKLAFPTLQILNRRKLTAHV